LEILGPNSEGGAGGGVEYEPKLGVGTENPEAERFCSEPHGTGVARVSSKSAEEHAMVRIDTGSAASL